MIKGVWFVAGMFAVRVANVDVVTTKKYRFKWGD